uniref:Fibronectin type-II domain-containing protein n=1 Tax=Naja naja TaxID=35670 RepID=A0A8C6Y4H8_NAJNA
MYVCNIYTPTHIYTHIHTHTCKVENLSCVFPFVYDGKLYFSCTTEGRHDGKRWCATTINYDLDKKWKFCPEELDVPTCVFPFIYKGKFYSVCIDEDMDNGNLWCSTSSNYDKDKKWQYCNLCYNVWKLCHRKSVCL